MSKEALAAIGIQNGVGRAAERGVPTVYIRHDERSPGARTEDGARSASMKEKGENDHAAH